MRRSGGSGRGEKLIVCWPGRQRRGSCYHPAMFSNLQKHTTLHFFLLNTEEISIHPCTHPTTATIQHFPLRISTKQSKAAGPLVSCSSMINPSCFQGYFSSQTPPAPSVPHTHFQSDKQSHETQQRKQFMKLRQTITMAALEVRCSL